MDSDTKRPEYDAPKVELVVTTEELAREIQYAGDPVSVPQQTGDLTATRRPRREVSWSQPAHFMSGAYYARPTPLRRRSASASCSITVCLVPPSYSIRPAGGCGRVSRLPAPPTT